MLKLVCTLILATVTLASCGGDAAPDDMAAEMSANLDMGDKDISTAD
jgi:outer membrane lipoprotein-sorting protein